MSALERIMSLGGVSVDVGANWGLYTRELARLSRQVHAFEPSHDMAVLLRRTVPGGWLPARPVNHGFRTDPMVSWLPRGAESIA